MLLEGWDDNAKKYIEAGTGGLHTKERCQEAKLKLEQKNDHGNESFTSIPISDEKPISPKEYVERLENKFVDHTAKGIPQFKVFTDDSADGLTEMGNKWIKDHPEHNVKLIGQLQMDKGMFAITLYYEEIKQ
jgi:hypothetical protein